MGMRLRRAAVAALALVTAACTTSSDTPSDESPAAQPADEPSASPTSAEPAGSGEVTLAFAGDVHFEGQVRRLIRRQGGGLGPIAATLSRADVAMVNLETAATRRRERDPKELEHAGDRYWFRAPPQALGVLAEAGVDVVSVANNHAGDYGAAGLADTVAAARRSGLAVVGAGRDVAAAFTPHTVRVGDLDVAFLAADTVQREGSSGVWRAGPDDAGTAAARERRPADLLAAVEAAAGSEDLVVVYLHWGREYQACPTQSQRLLARDLADAGADVVVGSHAHAQGGSGWAGGTYVSYGLGNFVWYHDRQPDTGVLTLRVDADGVVADDWTPARIDPDDGRPVPVAGGAREAGVRDWRERQRCTGLGVAPGEPQAEDPAYESSIGRVDAALAERMRTSHRPGCPVALADLRHLTMTYRDFDGRARTGEMVVHRRWARGVVEAFGRLYDAGWPVARMRLVDEYGGDDDASMAANNTSAFNCRRVAGQRNWSAHAHGAAIDLNPLQNPYVRGGSVDPPGGRRYARIDRTPRAPVPLGVIRAGDLPVTVFARLGWEWGGDWRFSKDFQHVAEPDVGGR